MIKYEYKENDHKIFHNFISRVKMIFPNKNKPQSPKLSSSIKTHIKLIKSFWGFECWGYNLDVKAINKANALKPQKYLKFILLLNILIVVAARYHKELLPGRPLLIDLIEDQPSFCKLIPHDSKSPAVFKIELQGEMAKKKKPEFKIYISTKVKEPTHNNHEKFVDSELRFMFKKGKIGDEFKFNTKIYLTILSKQAGSIILTVLFPHDNISQNDNNQKKQIPLRIKQKQLDENGQEIEVEYIRDIKSIEESFDRILKKEDAKRGLDSFKDYVGKNKSIMRQWSRTKLHNEFESRIRKIEYQQLAVSKRQMNYFIIFYQMIDEAKRERVQYLLNKKDIMLAQKEKILQAKREYLIKMQRNTKFVKLMRAKQVIKEIFIQFDLQQKKNRNYWDRYRCSKIIGKSFRKRETRKVYTLILNSIFMKGINFSVRTARMTAMSLIFFAQTQSDIQRNKAKEIIKQILIDHEASRRLKTSFFDFYRKIVYIQNANFQRVQSKPQNPLVRFISALICMVQLGSYWDQQRKRRFYVNLMNIQ